MHYKFAKRPNDSRPKFTPYYMMKLIYINCPYGDIDVFQL